MGTGKIKVLVVDDSALMRTMLGDILQSDPRIDVISTARDGRDAIDKIKTLRPDVVTMDVEMPNMSGIQALEEIMKTCPVPVVMVSSITHEGAEVTLKALSLGCVDFIAKPSGAYMPDINKVGQEIIEKVSESRKYRKIEV